MFKRIEDFLDDNDTAIFVGLLSLPAISLTGLLVALWV